MKKIRENPGRFVKDMTQLPDITRTKAYKAYKANLQAIQIEKDKQKHFIKIEDAIDEKEKKQKDNPKLQEQENR